MFIVVTGGSGSGKSAYAEDKILGFGAGRRFYVATMQCFDRESRERVARHRRMRAGKGFETIERQLDLAGLVLPVLKESAGGDAQCAPERTSVLLECMSNLAANEMFDPAGAGDGALRAIELGIDSLLKQCDNLVVVTNEIFSDGVSYAPETRAYQKLLGEINRYMAARADEAVEVVCGIPVFLKERERK